MSRLSSRTQRRQQRVARVSLSRVRHSTYRRAVRLGPNAPGTDRDLCARSRESEHATSKLKQIIADSISPYEKCFAFSASLSSG
jgi:hypothetical protein